MLSTARGTSSIVSALDKSANLQMGENGHMEYKYNTNTAEEQMVQIFFHITRGGDQSNTLKKYGVLLRSFNTKKPFSSWSVEEMTCFINLYKMVGHTRDIIEGKGIYSFAYGMVLEWYNAGYCDLAKYAIDRFVYGDDGDHQYGSWKDLKYLAEYVKQSGLEGISHPLIIHCRDLAVKQLRLEEKELDNARPNLSLISRWLPREKSKKFGWFAKMIAEEYYSMFIPKGTATAKQYLGGKNKCYTHYRQLLSELNHRLDTVQIKQCKNTWRDIDFNTITSITMTKQRTAFLNKTARGVDRCPSNEDRVLCANNLKQHIQDATDGKKTMKGKRVSLSDFVKDAISTRDEIARAAINAQWADNAKQNGTLPNIIAMVDTSGSMSCDNSLPLYSAIGLGCRVAEKSALGKRVLTFSARPSWVNLEKCGNFCEMVDTISDCDWGMNTNFTTALDLILDAIVENKLRPEDVESMILAVFSDMQIDQSGNEPITETMFSKIKRKYAETGMRLWGQPFNPPYILFWNLRPGSGFPCLTQTANTGMMSGNSPVLLNEFCNKGIEALKESTPIHTLRNMLKNKRYDSLGQYCVKTLYK